MNSYAFMRNFEDAGIHRTRVLRKTIVDIYCRILLVLVDN